MVIFPSGSIPAEVLEKAPGFAEAWHKRSIAYFAQKKFQEAVEDCRKVRWIWTYLDRNPGGSGGTRKVEGTSELIETSRDFMKLQFE